MAANSSVVDGDSADVSRVVGSMGVDTGFKLLKL